MKISANILITILFVKCRVVMGTRIGQQVRKIFLYYYYFKIVCYIPFFSIKCMTILCIYTDIFFPEGQLLKISLVFPQGWCFTDSIVSCFKINVVRLGPPEMNNIEEHRWELEVGLVNRNQMFINSYLAPAYQKLVVKLWDPIQRNLMFVIFWTNYSLSSYKLSRSGRDCDMFMFIYFILRLWYV